MVTNDGSSVEDETVFISYHGKEICECTSKSNKVRVERSKHSIDTEKEKEVM
jgi:hypothetical protein